MPKVDNTIELSKADFVLLLKEAKCLIIPKPQPKEAAGKNADKKEEDFLVQTKPKNVNNSVFF